VFECAGSCIGGMVADDRQVLYTSSGLTPATSTKALDMRNLTMTCMFQPKHEDMPPSITAHHVPHLEERWRALSISDPCVES
jgi:hypothetical protein